MTEAVAPSPIGAFLCGQLPLGAQFVHLAGDLGAGAVTPVGRFVFAAAQVRHGVPAVHAQVLAYTCAASLRPTAMVLM